MKSNFFFWAFLVLALIAFSGAIFGKAPHQFFTGILCLATCLTIYLTNNKENGKSN